MSGRHSRAQHRPWRSQHFLRRGLAADLVARSTISPGDSVIEIGAGRGALTFELAKRCSSLSAIEIDPAMCARLRQAFDGRDSVRVVEGDFFEEPLPSGRYKVFGNIPYDRTADIVRRLTSAESPPAEAYLVTQLEAAARFAGRPFGHETRLSLALKPWWHVEVIRTLRPADFSPPPRVQSAVLWLVRRSPPLVSPGEAGMYRDLVRNAFGSTGQTIEDGLRRVLTRNQVRRLASDLGFHAQAQPTTLAFEQWLAVFRWWVVGRTRP